MLIKLSPLEQEYAAYRGRERSDRGVTERKGDRYGLKLNSMDERYLLDINACGAELAAAKGLNRYWTGAFEFDKTAADVGNNIQVRSTKLKTGSLLLHPGDFDNHWYFLVIGEMPTYNIVGAILGKKGKAMTHYWRTIRGRSSLFIPQHELTPTEEIIKILKCPDCKNEDTYS